MSTTLIKAYESFFNFVDTTAESASRSLSVPYGTEYSQIFYSKEDSSNPRFFVMAQQLNQNLVVKIYTVTVSGDTYTPDSLLDTVEDFSYLNWAGNEDGAEQDSFWYYFDTDLVLNQGDYYAIVFSSDSTALGDDAPKIYYTKTYRNDIFPVFLGNDGTGWSNELIPVASSGNLRVGAFACGFVGKEVDDVDSFDSGTVSVGGTGSSSRRGYSTYMYVEDVSNSSKEVAVKFFQQPPTSSVYGTSEETDQSMMRWYFYKPATLPLSGKPFLNKATSSVASLDSTANFLVYTQPDKLPPYPKPYFPDSYMDMNYYGVGVVPLYESFENEQHSVQRQQGAIEDVSNRSQLEYWAHFAEMKYLGTDADGNRIPKKSANPSYIDFTLEQKGNELEVLNPVEVTDVNRESSYLRGFNNITRIGNYYVGFSKFQTYSIDWYNDVPYFDAILDGTTTVGMVVRGIISRVDSPNDWFLIPIRIRSDYEYDESQVAVGMENSVMGSTDASDKTNRYLGVHDTKVATTLEGDSLFALFQMFPKHIDDVNNSGSILPCRPFCYLGVSFDNFGSSEMPTSLEFKIIKMEGADVYDGRFEAKSLDQTVIGTITTDYTSTKDKRCIYPNIDTDYKAAKFIDNAILGSDVVFTVYNNRNNSNITNGDERYIPADQVSKFGMWKIDTSTLRNQNMYNTTAELIHTSSFNRTIFNKNKPSVTLNYYGISGGHTYNLGEVITQDGSFYVATVNPSFANNVSFSVDYAAGKWIWLSNTSWTNLNNRGFDNSIEHEHEISSILNVSSKVYFGTCTAMNNFTPDSVAAFDVALSYQPGDYVLVVSGNAYVFKCIRSTSGTLPLTDTDDYWINMATTTDIRTRPVMGEVYSTNDFINFEEVIDGKINQKWLHGYTDVALDTTSLGGTIYPFVNNDRVSFMTIVDDILHIWTSPSESETSNDTGTPFHIGHDIRYGRSKVLRKFPMDYYFENTFDMTASEKFWSCNRWTEADMVDSATAIEKSLDKGTIVSMAVVDSIVDVTFNSGARTIVSVATNFQNAGFSDGDRVFIRGSESNDSGGVNGKTFTILNVVTTTITLTSDSTALVSESAGATVSFRSSPYQATKNLYKAGISGAGFVFDKETRTISGLTAAITTHGFEVGDEIVVSGSLFNDGTYFIESVTETTIVVTTTSPQFTDETSAPTKTIQRFSVNTDPTLNDGNWRTTWLPFVGNNSNVFSTNSFNISKINGGVVNGDQIHIAGLQFLDRTFYTGNSYYFRESIRWVFYDKKTINDAFYHYNDDTYKIDPNADLADCDFNAAHAVDIYPDGDRALTLFPYKIISELGSNWGVYHGKSLAKYEFSESSRMVKDYPGYKVSEVNPRVGKYLSMVVGAVKNSPIDNTPTYLQPAGTINGDFYNRNPRLVAQSGIVYCVCDNNESGAQVFKTYGTKQLPKYWGLTNTNYNSNTEVEELVPLTKDNVYNLDFDSPCYETALYGDSPLAEIGAYGVSVSKTGNTVFLTTMKSDLSSNGYEGSAYNDAAYEYNNAVGYGSIAEQEKHIMRLTVGNRLPQNVSFFYNLREMAVDPSESRSIFSATNKISVASTAPINTDGVQTGTKFFLFKTVDGQSAASSETLEHHYRNYIGAIDFTYGTYDIDVYVDGNIKSGLATFSENSIDLVEITFSTEIYTFTTPEELKSKVKVVFRASNPTTAINLPGYLTDPTQTVLTLKYAETWEDLFYTQDFVEIGLAQERIDPSRLFDNIMFYNKTFRTDIQPNFFRLESTKLIEDNEDPETDTRPIFNSTGKLTAQSTRPYKVDGDTVGTYFYIFKTVNGSIPTIDGVVGAQLLTSYYSGYRGSESLSKDNLWPVDGDFVEAALYDLEVYIDNTSDKSGFTLYQSGFKHWITPGNSLLNIRFEDELFSEVTNATIKDRVRVVFKSKNPIQEKTNKKYITYDDATGMKTIQDPFAEVILKGLRFSDVDLGGAKGPANFPMKKVLVTGIINKNQQQEGTVVAPETILSSDKNDGTYLAEGGSIVVVFSKPLHVSKISLQAYYDGNDPAAVDSSLFNFYVIPVIEKQLYNEDLYSNEDWMFVGSDTFDAEEPDEEVSVSKISMFTKAIKIELQSGLILRLNNLNVKSFAEIDSGTFVKTGKVRNPELIIVDDFRGLLENDSNSKQSSAYATFIKNNDEIVMDLGEDIPMTRISMNVYNADPTRSLLIDVKSDAGDWESVYSAPPQNYEYSLVKWVPRQKIDSRKVDFIFLDQTTYTQDELLGFGLTQEVLDFVIRNHSSNFSTYPSNNQLASYSFRPNIFKDRSLTIFGSSTQDSLPSGYDGTFYVNTQMDEDGPFYNDISMGLGMIEKSLNIDFALKSVRKVRIKLSGVGNGEALKINSLKTYTPIIDEDGAFIEPTELLNWTIKLTSYLG